jgi:hypothetical protein
LPAAPASFAVAEIERRQLYFDYPQPHEDAQSVPSGPGSR